jgi:Icc-related predicted phosphoesterase
MPPPGQQTQPPAPKPDWDYVFSSLDFEKVPLDDVVSFLRETSGLNIVMLWPPGQTGEGIEVSGLHGKNMSLPQVLEILKRSLGIDYRVVGGPIPMLEITLPHFEKVVQVYDLGPAISRLMTEPAFARMEDPDVRLIAVTDNLLKLLTSVAELAGPGKPLLQIHKESSLLVARATQTHQGAISQVLDQLTRSQKQAENDQQLEELQTKASSWESLSYARQKLEQARLELEQELTELRKQNEALRAEMERLVAQLAREAAPEVPKQPQ